jgi:hypothetical protein
MNFNLELDTACHAYKLLVGLVAPRPISLISSMDENGNLNAAPFSAYNYRRTDPPIIYVGVTNRPGQPFVEGLQAHHVPEAQTDTGQDRRNRDHAPNPRRYMIRAHMREQLDRNEGTSRDDRCNAGPYPSLPIRYNWS